MGKMSYSNVIDDNVSPAGREGDRNDEDEMNLLATAAGMWAKGKEQEEYENEECEQQQKLKENKQKFPVKTTTFHSSKSVNGKFSLHVTQLPYSTDQNSIRKVFSNRGCLVTSVRCIYDHDTQKFKGIAFVDVANSKSFETALKMDKMHWVEPEKNNKEKDLKKQKQKFRRINVRPTRTKEELANIVKCTAEKQAALRLMNQDLKKRLNDNSKNKSSKRLKVTTSTNKFKEKEKNTKTITSNNLHPETKKGKSQAVNKKLNRKEKAKKAAIIGKINKKK